VNLDDVQFPIQSLYPAISERHLNHSYWLPWLSDNTPASYLGGPRFKSQCGDWLS
jgi:hypothetical protein